MFTCSKLNPLKLYEIEDITTVSIKKYAPKLAPVLPNFYNNCVVASCFPTCRKFSSVIQVLRTV